MKREIACLHFGITTLVRSLKTVWNSDYAQEGAP